MRFSLRTLSLLISLFAVCVISLVAYRTWRFQFDPKPTEFALYLADDNGIVQYEINSTGDSFDISVVNGQPLHLFLESRNFHANNNGELGFSTASAPITIEVDEKGELNYVEGSDTYDVRLEDAMRLGANTRTVRTGFQESFSRENILRIRVSTELLDDDDNILHKQYKEITLTNTEIAE